MKNVTQDYNILIAKKTEKIVTAIYLISQFLENEEPLKYEIRNIANLLLKDINSIAYTNINKSNLNIKNIFKNFENSLNNLSTLISYLHVAKNTNLISSMNIDIVIEGLRSLELVLIQKQFVLNKEDLFIEQENDYQDILSNLNDNNLKINNEKKLTSFDISESKEKIILSHYHNNDSDNNQSLPVKNTISTIKESFNLIKDSEKNIVKDYKRQIINKPLLTIKKEKEIKVNLKKENIDKRKTDRKDQILSIFNKGIEISINDISKKIIGCSTKTLQRELNDLVSESKIKKIGEKRWSKYILI